MPTRAVGGVVAAVWALALTACSGSAPPPEGPEPAGPEAAVAPGPGTAAGAETAATPGARIVQPGAPGQASRPAGEDATTVGPALAHTEADVRFMQHMILHHAQALEMARLVPDRTTREDLRLLARRIDRSQDDEIRLMARWLEARGQAVPEAPGPGEWGAQAAHGHAGHGGSETMPGMLTPEQMATLEAATGEAFDRLFLELMIIHHEGAVDMVEALFATPGSAQDTEIFRFASHVDSDQRMEIWRMERLLHREVRDDR